MIQAFLPDILSALSGAAVGLVLGLVGGGGSILAVPLLIYVVGITSTHLALGTSAVAVGAAALLNLIPHWRAGNIKWRCAFVFSLFGVIGAFAGSSIAKLVDGQALLAAFGVLMIVIGIVMLMKRGKEGDPLVRLSRKNAFTLGPRLSTSGFAVGLLAGFFGIGGGFLIVPGLMLATSMPITFAVGTSLVSVASFGFATATNYAISGLVDWRVALVFIVGGLIGGLVGVALTGWLKSRQHLLQIGFAVLVIGIGISVVWRGVAPFFT